MSEQLEEFEKWADGFDHESREWLDMGNDKVFAAGYESRQPEIDALRAENDHLRASLANSSGPCVYCNLPKEEWAKCASGFPGCARSDDAMLCPNAGASLETEEQNAALMAENERLRNALQTPESIISLIGSNFLSKSKSMDGDLASVKYVLTVHDLISAFSSLFDDATEVK